MDGPHWSRYSEPQGCVQCSTAMSVPNKSRLMCHDCEQSERQHGVETQQMVDRPSRVKQTCALAIIFVNDAFSANEYEYIFIRY